MVQPLNSGDWSDNKSSESYLGSRAGLDDQIREFPLLGIKPRFLGGPARSLVTVNDRLISTVTKLCCSKRKAVTLKLRY
jgi:hypothetical protein